MCGWMALSISCYEYLFDWPVTLVPYVYGINGWNFVTVHAACWHLQFDTILRAWLPSSALDLLRSWYMSENRHVSWSQRVQYYRTLVRSHTPILMYVICMINYFKIWSVHFISLSLSNFGSDIAGLLYISINGNWL